MRYPEFLKTGDTIGFPAPSFGCNIEPYRTAFNHAQEVLREKGFQTICGPNAYAGDGIGISSSPQLQPGKLRERSDGDAALRHNGCAHLLRRRRDDV